MNYELAYVFEDFLNVSLGYLDCNSPKLIGGRSISDIVDNLTWKFKDG